MKLSIIDRFLVFLSMVLMLCAGIALVLVSTGVFTFEYVAKILHSYLLEPFGVFAYLIVGILIVLISIKIILSMFSSGDKHAANVPKETNEEKIVLNSSDNGEVMVSTEVIKDMAIKYAKTSNKVKDVDCKVVMSSEGTKVFLKVYVVKDVVLKEFMSAMQSEIKEYVEKYSGTKILSVDICADVNNNVQTARVR